MGILYHGSKTHGIKRLEPRKSTHGNYVYATPYKVLAVHFSGRCGDDLVYSLGHFGSEKEGPFELVENVPGALEKMYSNSSSIYELSDETFKDIHTGFSEVVSEVGVDVIKEEYCPNVYDEIFKLEKEGLLKIYRYPDKPEYLKKDFSDIFDKWRYYKREFNKTMGQNNFDRLIYLHPNLLEQANELLKEFGIDYQYSKNDIVRIFQERINRQLEDLTNEQYIECSYQMICEFYPELTDQATELFNYYESSLPEKTEKEIR